MSVEMSGAPVVQDSEVSLYLHAELLPNIRQITLYISLPQTPALNGIRPEIQLSESRKAVTVVLQPLFDHVTETIKLPARVSDATRRTLNANTAPTAPSKPGQPGTSHDYSFRMQIDPSEQALAPRDELTDDHVPWTAADMSSSTRIRCCACGTAFLNESSLRKLSDQEELSTARGWVWKDLPSGNWAEMMDFWHCHKPDPHDDAKDEATAALRIEEQNAQVKGYGASSRVVAIPGNVLIDVATFLLAESDCVGLEKVSSPNIYAFFPHLSQAIPHIWIPFCISTLLPGQLRRRPFLFHGVAFDTIALDQYQCAFMAWARW